MSKFSKLQIETERKKREYEDTIKSMNALTYIAEKYEFLKKEDFSLLIKEVSMERLQANLNELIDRQNMFQAVECILRDEFIEVLSKEINQRTTILLLLLLLLIRKGW